MTSTTKLISRWLSRYADTLFLIARERGSPFTSMTATVTVRSSPARSPRVTATGLPPGEFALTDIDAVVLEVMGETITAPAGINPKASVTDRPISSAVNAASGADSTG